MWAIRGYKYERPRLQQNVDYLAKYRFDFDRILAQVGWLGNDITESWTDHVECMAGVVDYAYSRGVRTSITGIGGGTYNPDRVIDNVIQVVEGRQDKILYLEVANEWWSNFEQGEAKMRMLGKKLLSLGVLVALSAPREELATARNIGWVSVGAANMGTAHFDRDDKKGDWKWRHIRKPWESRNPPFPSSHGEPGGPRSSVAEYIEPIHLVMSRAVGILCGFDGYVLHNAAGVAGQVDAARRRPANLWEVPGIDAIMTAVRGLDEILPPITGKLTRGGQSGHPLSSDAYWVDKQLDHGVVRDYARRVVDAQGRTVSFVEALMGVKHHAALKADDDYKLTFINPVTHGKFETSVKKGNTVRIDSAIGARDSKQLAGWIVVGHRA